MLEILHDTRRAIGRPLIQYPPHIRRMHIYMYKSADITAGPPTAERVLRDRMSRCMHLGNDVVRGILPKTGVLSSPHIARPPLPTMPISRAPQTNAEEGLREQATARATAGDPALHRCPGRSRCALVGVLGRPQLLRVQEPLLVLGAQATEARTLASRREEWGVRVRYEAEGRGWGVDGVGKAHLG